MADISTETEQVSMLGLCEQDMNRFGKILRVMNLDNIPSFASNVRQYGHCSEFNSCTQAQPETCSISCKVITPPLSGSFHIVFPIEFTDGVKWMLKVPANGDHFDFVAAAALVSEARTMQMLRRETSVPVPTVYAFDASSENALLAPFILMEKLDGKPLYHLWFDSEMPKARLEHFRIKALQSLAGAMVQLNKFILNTGGSLVFRSDGTPIDLAGAKAVDGVATFNKARASKIHHQDFGQGGNDRRDQIHVIAADSNTPEASRRSQPCADKIDEDDDIWERGPFTHPKAYFMSYLDRSDPAFRADAYERGTDMCLRLFIEWAFADSRNDGSFVLTHPDLDVQNILVAEDGTLTGLIDWDGVATVPREVGCAQYPLWLMRDWVPMQYRYDIQNGETFAEAGYVESSPAELATYRALYSQLMEAELGRMTGGSNKTTTFGTLPMHEAGLTRRSLVMRNLDLSTGNPWAALGTVNHIIDQIEELTAPEWEDTDSDTDSISSCSSASVSDSSVDSEADNEDKGTEPDTNEQGLTSGRTDLLTYQEDQCFEGREGIESETVKVARTSWGVAQQNQGNQSPSKEFQIDVDESKTQTTSTTDLHDESSAPSGPLGWTRRLLCCGCHTVEKFLRRIAKFGYVLEDAVDNVAEVLARVDAKELEPFSQGNPEQVVKNETPQKQFDDLPSTQPVVNSEQVNKTTSLPPTLDPQDIPLRKAELLQAARMKKKADRKAHYLADKAATRKELKVWENIALAVWVRGVSLEQLQLNQGKIASWVVDTLRPEEDDKDDLTANPHRIPTAEATASATEFVNSTAAIPGLSEDCSIQSKEEPKEVRLEEDVLRIAGVEEDGLRETPRVTTADFAGKNGLESKVHQISRKATTKEISALKRSMFHIYEDKNDESESPTTNPPTGQPQPRLSSARKWPTSKPNDGNKRVDLPVVARVLTEGTEDQPLSKSLSASGDHIVLRKLRSTYSIGFPCASETSHFTQVFDDRSQFNEDSGRLSSNSSVHNRHGNEEHGSDTGVTHSTATSLNYGEAEDGVKQNVKKGEYDTSEITQLAANEGHIGHINRHSSALFAQGSSKKDGPAKSCAPQSVYDTYSEHWVEADRYDENTKAGSTFGTRSEVKVGEIIDTSDGGAETDADSENGSEDGAGEDEGSHSASEVELPEFEDHGGFDRYTVCNLLGMGQLDELRLLRLKEGFLKLLEQY